MCLDPWTTFGLSVRAKGESHREVTVQSTLSTQQSALVLQHVHSPLPTHQLVHNILMGSRTRKEPSIQYPKLLAPVRQDPPAACPIPTLYPSFLLLSKTLYPVYLLYTV